MSISCFKIAKIPVIPSAKPIEKMLSWRPESRPKAEILSKCCFRLLTNLRADLFEAGLLYPFHRILQTRTTAPDVAELVGQTIPIHERRSGDSIDPREPDRQNNKQQPLHFITMIMKWLYLPNRSLPHSLPPSFPSQRRRTWRRYGHFLLLPPLTHPPLKS